ncbi:AAA family ATPase, partial [Escherichia coli]|nr:AAA family ATPase [Escherichia coli]
MLITFSGQNYKAYESFKLSLKPLTILLGANSCGKSALINSLLMFSQSVDSMSLSDSALRLNGPKVGMGEALNIIKNKDDSKTLSFSFDFSDNTVVKNGIDTLRRETLESFAMIMRFTVQTVKNNDALVTKANDLINEASNAIVNFDEFEEAELKVIADKLCQLLLLFREAGDNVTFSRATSENLRKFIYECPLKRIKDCLTKVISISGNKLS